MLLYDRHLKGERQHMGSFYVRCSNEYLLALGDILKMTDIYTPSSSVFVSHDHIQHAGLGCKAMHHLQNQLRRNLAK